MKLIIKNVQKNYGKNKVLDIQKYMFETGKIYTILGKNGSGKTTFFTGIYKENFLDSGIIEIELDDSKEKKINFKDVGFVSATPQLPDFFTGYEFTKFVLETTWNRKVEQSEVFKQLELVNLTKAEGLRLIKEYSLGMKSKLQILSFVIMKPRIILLDEPFVALDIISASQIKKIVKKLKYDHIILFSTHIMSLAEELADEIVLLKDGNLETICMEAGNSLEESVVKKMNAV